MLSDQCDGTYCVILLEPYRCTFCAMLSVQWNGTFCAIFKEQFSGTCSGKLSELQWYLLRCFSTCVMLRSQGEQYSSESTYFMFTLKKTMYGFKCKWQWALTLQNLAAHLIPTFCIANIDQACQVSLHGPQALLRHVAGWQQDIPIECLNFGMNYTVWPWQAWFSRPV